MNYLYGMRLRGASPGAQPKGFEIVTEKCYIEFPPKEANIIRGAFYDVLRYTRKLTDKEVSDYDLEFIGTDEKEKT